MSKPDTEKAEEPVCADEWATHKEDNTTPRHKTNTAWNRQINRSHYKAGVTYILSFVTETPHTHKIKSTKNFRLPYRRLNSHNKQNVLPQTRIGMCHKASFREHPEMKQLLSCQITKNKTRNKWHSEIINTFWKKNSAFCTAYWSTYKLRHTF